MEESEIHALALKRLSKDLSDLYNDLISYRCCLVMAVSGIEDLWERMNELSNRTIVITASIDNASASLAIAHEREEGSDGE